MRYLKKKFRVQTIGFGKRELCPNCKLPLKITIHYLTGYKEIIKECSCGYKEIRRKLYEMD